MEKTIIVPSTLESLRAIEKLVDEFAAGCNMDNLVYGNVLVASLEAVNNAIVHGNKLDKKKEVLFSIRCSKKEVHLLIKDQGEGFDYEHVPDPTAPENIENISGRGIFLMHKLSDNLVFEDKGSTVKLIFKIN